MMDYLLFGTVGLYFVASVLQFAAVSFKKDGLRKASWITFLIGLAAHTVYLVVRGIMVHRLPLSNQFEFACAFAWGVGLLLVILGAHYKAPWMAVAAMPMAFLILSYALLQPREMKSELMPALQSAWFGFHIGSAVFSYSAFMLAGATGLRYLVMDRKSTRDDAKLRRMDHLSYRLVALGVFLLTVTILTGAIWAEQAWGSFWTWDPKEVWALITWLLYAVYLHLRLRKKHSGRAMAWFVVIAIPIVFFTFAGVNTFMSGLHSYG